MVAVAYGPRFRLGRVVITPAAMAEIHPHEVARALARHGRGDWGDLGADDWRENDRCLHQGGRLLSVYRGDNGAKFWIITESDRSVTTVLLPEDY
jgi:hypothetical protein